MTHILSSYPAFVDTYKDQPFLSDQKRTDALKRYFERGGVVKVTPNGSSWPKVIYPSSDRLNQQLRDVQQLKNQLVQKKQSWSNSHTAAKRHEITLQIKKVTDPLYWRHQVKKLTDADYRNDVEKTKIPMRLVSDTRYRPMVEMFINNIDYRKQLTETVETSVVYRHSKIAQYAETRAGFREEVSKNQVDDLTEKLKEVELDLIMYQELLKWVKS